MSDIMDDSHDSIIELLDSKIEVAVTIVLLSAIAAGICQNGKTNTIHGLRRRHFDFPGGGRVAKYRSFCSLNMHLKLRDRHLAFFHSRLGRIVFP